MSFKKCIVGFEFMSRRNKFYFTSLLFSLLFLALLMILRGMKKDAGPQMILYHVLLMSASLGVASFAVGMLPLLFSCSSTLTTYPFVFILISL